MKLSDADLRQYETMGFLLLPALLKDDEVAALRTCVERVSAVDSEARMLEPDGATVRLVFGVHASDPTFARLSRDPRILGPARQLLGFDVYVHQSKITMKTPLAGEGWPWHQDFAFWGKRDGLPAPWLVNAVVFLDDVTALNGPIFFLSGSHSHGLHAPEEYLLGRDEIRSLAERHPIAVPTGPAGSVLFFHANLVHGSPSNIGPYDRTLGFITYNRVDNVPRAGVDLPPEYMAGRDHRPLELFRDGE